MIAAERAGYEWFAGIWRFLAPLAGLLALSGFVAAVLTDISWLAIVAVIIGLLLLLFIEGTYSLWREADTRATETSTASLGDELGEFHAEGTELLRSVPRIHDDEANELDPWRERADDWVTRVVGILSAKAPRWRTVFLASPGGLRFSGNPYSAFNKLRDDIGDRLKQLEKIIGQV